MPLYQLGTTQATLAVIVTEAIRSQGLTVQDIARSTLIPRATLDRSLAGARPFTTPELAAIGRVLGTTGSALLAEAESEAAA